MIDDSCFFHAWDTPSFIPFHTQEKNSFLLLYLNSLNARQFALEPDGATSRDSVHRGWPGWTVTRAEKIFHGRMRSPGLG